MTELDNIKSDLRSAIDNCRADGTYEDAVFESIDALIKKLVPHSPTPRPHDSQKFIESPWGSHFAQFGPKHTAGKPIKHETSLKLQSFAQFPDTKILVEDIDQEIMVEGNHYNNVTSVKTLNGEHRATLIVWGRYSVTPEEPQRYAVDFYAIELRAPDGVSDADLRSQFDLDEDFALYREMKPPKLHSDIVYCDDDMRINFGSMGGVYVMRRLDGPGKSVSFE